MPSSWEEFWKLVTTFFTDNAWAILGFFVALVGGIIVIKLVLMASRRIMKARQVDPMAIRFISAVVRYALLLILVLILLAIMGVSIGGLVTAFSAAVLAVGMALKDFVSHLASGIILIGSKKYHKGDYIIVNGVEGSVEDINFLFTTLHTPNNTQVTLPNTTMVNSEVTNLGSYDTRRVAITFTVAYESDTKLVIETLLKVANSCGLVLKDPAPACHLKTLSESSIDFFLTCFCDKEDYWETYFYIMDHGFDECKRAGIGFPFKQVEVTQKTPPETMPIAYESLPPRVEKVRPKKRRKVTVEDWEDMGIVEMARTVAQTGKPKKKPAKPKKPKGKEPAAETEEKPAK